MRRFTTRAIAVGVVTFGSVGACASVASAAKSDPQKVTICHATASATNPYVQITVDIASVVGDAGHGHNGVNLGDIIPPIPTAGYAGNNWDTGAATWLNGCNPSSVATGYLNA